MSSQINALVPSSHTVNRRPPSFLKKWISPFCRGWQSSTLLECFNTNHDLGQHSSLLRPNQQVGGGGKGQWGRWNACLLWPIPSRCFIFVNTKSLSPARILGLRQGRKTRRRDHWGPSEKHPRGDIAGVHFRDHFARANNTTRLLRVDAWRQVKRLWSGSEQRRLTFQYGLFHTRSSVLHPL